MRGSEDILNVYNKWYKLGQNKRCARQRARKGFCKRDTYEINSWFLQIMPKMLTYLKEHNVGYPNFVIGEFYDKNKDRIKAISRDDFMNWMHRDEYKEIYDESSDWCFERWNQILEEMIFKFNECDNEKCSMKNEFEEDANRIKQAHSKDLKTLEDQNILEKYDIRENEIYYYQKNCKKEALNLFVKYFDDLWW